MPDGSWSLHLFKHHFQPQISEGCICNSDVQGFGDSLRLKEQGPTKKPKWTTDT